MDSFEKSKIIMGQLFSRDYQFALATVENNIPSIRYVDTYFDGNYFYIVTDNRTTKIRNIEKNPAVCLCSKRYHFTGLATNIGHPLLPLNGLIRDKIVQAFETWYFKKNNEHNDTICYIKIKPVSGFFYKDGVGFRVDFENQKAEEFPYQLNRTVID